MTVRDLVHELIYCDMDAEIELHHQIDVKNIDLYFDIEVQEEYRSRVPNKVIFKID